jgi:hypothetical protein
MYNMYTESYVAYRLLILYSFRAKIYRFRAHNLPIGTRLCFEEDKQGSYISISIFLMKLFYLLRKKNCRKSIHLLLAVGKKEE